MSDDPVYILRSGVDRVVHQLLHAEHGNDAIVQRPISPTIDVMHAQPANYTHGIEAALKVQFRARALVNEYALKARGNGVSWYDLSSVLDVEPDHEDPAGAAFLEVAPRPSGAFDRIRTSWTCASCGQRVTDYGPYNGNPIDDEEGHAETCQRLADEMAIVRRRWQEDDDPGMQEAVERQALRLLGDDGTVELDVRDDEDGR